MATRSAGRPSGVVPRSEYQDMLCRRRAQPGNHAGDRSGYSTRGYANGAGSRSGHHAASAEAAFQAMQANPGYPPGGPAASAHGAAPAVGSTASSPSRRGGIEMQLCAQISDANGISSHNPGLPHGAGLSGNKASRRVRDNFVNRVVQKCGPAVVRVETEQKVDIPEGMDFFSILFGIKPDKSQKERRVHGHGSGFCVDGASGLILTNAHVVQGADRVSVTFSGRETPAECEVLETDEVIDLACIRVKDKSRLPLPSMPLGRSESASTGDWAIVLGNPFGLQNTCTLGIVSSLDRSTGETGYDWMRHPLIQTDAAVNQGNSGGPLLNEDGEVIGMISMRAMHGEGIGFAIPADSIRAAMPSLVQRKKVPRAYLGLKMSAEAPGGDGRRVGRSSGLGAYVEAVLPRSPAQRAGFEVQDHIVEVGAGSSGLRKVRHFDEVQALVRSVPVGTRISFKVKRGGHSKSLTVEAADIRHLKEETEKSGASRRPDGVHRVIIMP